MGTPTQKSWIIYCHVHVETGRRYMGLTTRSMERRWSQHLTQSKILKTHFANAIRKYGLEAFSHEILEVCHDQEVAELAERSWIELFDSTNPEKGFNLAKGGDHICW
jgi:group I intron endonuclease